MPGMAGVVAMPVLGMFDLDGLGVTLRLGAELVQTVLAAEVEMLALVMRVERTVGFDSHAAYRVAERVGRRRGGIGGVMLAGRRGGHARVPFPTSAARIMLAPATAGDYISVS
ncbi:hypothetical protein D3C81_1924830 [compost metagenome]